MRLDFPVSCLSQPLLRHSQNWDVLTPVINTKGVFQTNKSSLPVEV